jgi:hypothetical protein
MTARSTALLAALVLTSAGPAFADSPVNPDGGAPAPHPLSVKLHELASGKATLESLIDPANGLTTVDYIEAMPNDDKPSKPTIGTQHLCGAALKKETKALQARIAGAMKRADAGTDLDCNGNECILAGMEYSPSIHFVFADATSAAPKLTAINTVSEAALPTEWTDKAQAYVLKSLKAADAKPCTVAKAPRK